MAYRLRLRLWPSPSKGYFADDEHADNDTDSDQQEDQSMSDGIPPSSENTPLDKNNSEISYPEDDEDDEDKEDYDEEDEHMEDTYQDAYADTDDHGNSNDSYGSYDTNDSMFNEVHPLIDAKKERFIYKWLNNLPEDMSTPPDVLGLGHDEDSLRDRAIEWMEELYQDLPNGIVVAPPPWYGYSKFFVGPDRPRTWIKDWKTGRVRPREMTDNVLVSLALVERVREMGSKGVS